MLDELDDAHVWRVNLSTAPAAEHLLTPDEHVRADAFRDAGNRRRFVAARACLRTLLGAVTGTDPGAIRFGYTSHGRPYLQEPLLDIRFNLAHSGDDALVGMIRSIDIGVDIERVTPLSNWSGVAARFFTHSEVAAIHQLADLSPQQHAFLACWTRKEALIKAVGLGLSCPLNSFEVSVSPSEPARVLSIEGSAEAAAEWQLEDLSRFPSCAAAVAFRSRTARLRVHESAGCVIPSR